MATNFPASLDTLTNPTSSDSLSSPSHSAQHANVNDAVEALQAKVGADSSAVATSLDYKVAQLEAISHGKILQVVSTTKTDTFSTSSTSYVAITGLTAAITPSSATSKILIIAQISGSGAIFFSRLSGGNAGTYVGDAAGSRVQSATQMSSGSTDASTTTIVFLDSPATAASVTYGVEIRRGGISSETLVVNGNQDASDNTNRGRMASSITVMEVSA